MTSTNETTTTVADQPVMARIACPCGFEVRGVDETHNVEAFEAHNCPNEPEDASTPWYGVVFSFWGWAIFATLAYATGAILHAKQW